MIKTPWSSRASPGSSARPGSTNSPRRTSCRRTWTSNDARNWSRAMPQTTDIVDVNATIAYLADELRPRLAPHPLIIGIPTGSGRRPRCGGQAGRAPPARRPRAAGRGAGGRASSEAEEEPAHQAARTGTAQARDPGGAYLQRDDLQFDSHGRLRHLLTIEGLPRQTLLDMLNTAESFLSVGERELKKQPLLRGK